MSRAVQAKEDWETTPARRRIDLGIPRFASSKEVASLFGFSPHWMHKLRKRKKAPPHLAGVRPYRYDTYSQSFYRWLEAMGAQVYEPVDSVEGENV